MLQPMLAKWSADEEWWLRYNCKTFAALKAPALAPYTANTARADASPAPACADANPVPATRAQATKAEEANFCHKSSVLPKSYEFTIISYNVTNIT